jgi:ribokinase
VAGPGVVVRVGVVGSCNVDLVVRCDHLPRPGETVLGGDVTRLAGGKGANQAAAAARLGARVALIACLGRDEAGEWLLSELSGRGVDVSTVQRSARPTGTAFITLDGRGQNQIVVAPGANGDLDAAPVDLAAFDVVLAQLEVAPAVIADVAARCDRLVLNVAPARAVEPEALSRCAVVIANEVEAESLDVAALEHVVVTRGERGAAVYRLGRELARAEALRVEPVDTVGAGDVFCAAYALQWARGASEEDALRFAVAAGSLATLGLGAQGALPAYEEVERWLESA